ncbi:pimeloyl-ACP methyl esterase BioG family protein [Ancylomarina longa]|uniref:DUF452 family protein n=1 Tax=Ancylomarina longa TaxID=2487017 RepID=A0A434AER1_9BACT|nr:pimeloyl-ACP methyl esterase BioG family protein [Ancylomarina longa]RUT72880.1 DUF452 family protein [Ancylomarina longa]
MKTTWLKKSNSEKCILFMNGWGCDSHPFEMLTSIEYDVLVCYDYCDILIKPEVEHLFDKYEEIHLIAWSLGVYVGNLILNHWKELFTSTIAINGTLSPIDNLKGISPAVFQATIDQLNDKNLEKFWNRMCGSKSEFIEFQNIKPKRIIEDQKNELKILQNVIQNHIVDWNLFNIVLIGGKDLIFSSDNQIRAWGIDHNIIIKDEFPHYCFNRWKSWDDLIENLIGENTKNK